MTEVAIDIMDCILREAGLWDYVGEKADLGAKPTT